MNKSLSVWAIVLAASSAQAAVFLDEVFVNPPGSGYDDTREFVELQGTPGMKLDGYAVAFVNGGLSRYYPLGSVPPFPADMEIDELFSLDGLSLGANGLLVIGIGVRSQYGAILADTNYQRWNTLWNGGLDTPGKLNNDGSSTILLVRNRPGRTQADPGDPAGLRWGKDVSGDQELFTPVTRTYCNGGSRAGKHCECADDCPGGGACQASDFCLGGTNDGDACSVAGDCPLGSCVNAVDQVGDGSLDQGNACVGGANEGLACSVAGDCPGGACQTLLDLRGASTPNDITDDLEVVDEVSWEDGGGHEYDLDDRHVDAGVCLGGANNGQLCDRNCDCPGGACVTGTMGGLPRRRVHALDNPQSFNPDALTRVDYRTKGTGWTPAPGAYGELAGGNNWQDTATEQWIRGESLENTSGQGNAPWFFFDSAANADPNAIQPYMTNVPLWLNDGVAPDYTFTDFSFQIMAGRVNPLAVPYIPGDSDRDGDCDADDIARLAAVFGDDNWVFSNSYSAAPEGDSGNPAMQTRPWDVDATGDNGIEPSDLQWTLNFQGNTTGRVVGLRYDSTIRTSLAGGVALNPAPTDAVPAPGNNTVGCTVAANYSVSSGRTLSTLRVGDLVVLTVAAQVASGAINTAGQENGVMQYVNDVIIADGGVLRVRSVQPLGSFHTTREAIQSLQGDHGDLGVAGINGYTAGFTQGLAGPVSMYEVTLQATHIGNTSVSVGPAAMPKLAASTPRGLKLGHTNNHGNPASASYPAIQGLSVTSTTPFDGDGDGDVDNLDLQDFYTCATGPNLGPIASPGCLVWDRDADQDIDSTDFGVVQKCITGSGGTPEQNCEQ